MRKPAARSAYRSSRIDGAVVLTRATGVAPRAAVERGQLLQQLVGGAAADAAQAAQVGAVVQVHLLRDERALRYIHLHSRVVAWNFKIRMFII